MSMTAIQPSVTNSPAVVQVDRRRYRQVVRFFAGVTLNILWWEVIMRRIIGVRRVAAGRSNRFRRYTADFRKLAIRMGGVMIKLGQFVSARVDVMPPAIIEELADLQDEVPAEDFSAMRRVFESELGAPPEQVFAEFNTTVRAAASLGQVYQARLHSGERVIVKVQRPNIDQRVATDLAALSQVARWTMWWPLIRNRADVPALLEEFAHTLWQELDYTAEANHAERFQALFASDRRVYVPSIYRDFSTRRVITLEDVTSIKITDHAALDSAGVDRSTAARHLLDIYLQMIFEFGFFHADPHPGNLFIYPLPDQAAQSMYGDRVPHSGRAFYVVFVDFGMVGYITDEVKAGLREMLIAVATRDAARVIKAYEMLGVLLPSSDPERLEAAQREVMDKMWGRSVPELAQMPRSEMRQIAVKYRDLIYEMPFQVPQDFIYLGRAVGMLSGICTGLDPIFNPWQPVADYAQRFVTRQAAPGIKTIIAEAAKLGQAALALPNQAQDVMSRIQRGDLTTRINAGDDLKRDLRRIEIAISGLTRGFIFGSLAISASILTAAGWTIAGWIGFGLAAIAFLSLLIRRRDPQ